MNDIKKTYPLNPKFFDATPTRGPSPEYHLNPQVRTMLLKMSSNLQEDCLKEIENTKIPFGDSIFTGSLCSVNFDQLSDIDLHIMVDYSGLDKQDAELLTEFLGLYFKNWNLNEYTIYGYKVEAFPQDINMHLEAEGNYNLTTDQWDKMPDLTNKLEYTSAQFAKAKSYLDRIKDIRANPISDAQKYYDQMKAVWDEIKLLRKTGMESPEGMFSEGNRVFKILRRNGALNMLIDSMKKTKKQLFSITENKHIYSFKTFISL